MSRSRKEKARVDPADSGMGLDSADVGRYTSAMFGLRAEGYELKGDGKKRKFKPFEAVRKFFGKNKRKSKDEQVSVVAVKAKSTTALHDDEDDDGGFKGHQPRPLGGNRSISEDSVFSPEQRDTNLQALKKTAVSEESIPKSAFQAELFSKLNKRRSQYSDDDDGLPHSPTPAVTTADIIMGGPLKPVGGKSTSRESDKSLISMDGSENEEEDLFQSRWKSSVPSKMSKTEQSGGSEGPIDFDKMGSTELLKSDAARDRISIKRRARKATHKSQIKRDGSSPHSLPSLNEESPTKSQAGEETAASPKKAVTPQDSVVLEVSIPSNKEKKPEVTLKDKGSVPETSQTKPARPGFIGSSHKADTGPPLKSPVRPASGSEDVPKVEAKRSSLKSTTAAVSVEEGGVSAKRASFVEASSKDVGKETRASIKGASLTNDYENVVVPPSATSGASRKGSPPASAKISLSPSSSLKEKGQSGLDIVSSSKPQPVSGSVQSVATTSSGAKSPTADAGKPSLSSGIQDSVSQSLQKPVEGSASACITITSSASPAVQTSAGADSKSPTSAGSPSLGENRKEGLRPTDGQTATYSPKDDYKLKRQSRSKTLPEQPISKDEQFAAKVQRTASHRMEPSSSQNASPEPSPRLRFANKTRDGTEKERSVESTPTKKEPEWFALARKKTGRLEEKEEKDSPASSPTKEPAAAKESLSISVSELSGPATKADTASAVKSESVTAVKSEPISAPKSDTVAPVSKTSESVSSPSIFSATAKFEKPAVTAVTNANDVPRTPVRGGSVKTSPTKVNTASAFANRGSSVKILSTRSDLGSPKKETVAVTSTQNSGVTAPVQEEAKKEETKKEEPVKKEEPKSSELKKEETKSLESSSVKEIPKWKTQSTKAFSATPAATPISARFGSVKAASSTTSLPTTAPTASSTATAKTDSKPSSPTKTVGLSKAASLDSPAKEKEEPKAVPAWRANLGAKKTGGLGADIKIELIESSSGSAKSAATEKKEEAASKKQESPTKAPPGNKDTQSDQCRGSAATNRSSKVLDLVKNFQNLQVS